MASDSQLKTRRETTTQKLKTRFVSLLWILAFVFISHYVDLVDILTNGSGFWYNLTIFSLCGFLGCFIYINYYLPMVCNFKVNYDQWETQIPGTIKIATSTGILFLISSTTTLWSDLGIISLLLVFLAIQAFISLFTFV